MKNDKLIQLKRILLQGLNNLLRNKTMIFASLLVMVLTMVIIGICYSVVENIDNLINLQLGREYSVSIYLNEDISDKDAAQFENLLKSDKRIEKYEYISKEKAYSDLKNTFPDKDFDKMFQDKNKDFLPVSFNITLFKTDQTQPLVDGLLKVTYKDLGITPGTDYTLDTPVISDFNSTESTVSTVERMKSIVYTAGIAATGIFIFFSVIITSNTIMLSIYARKKEIEIMNSIGATKLYIQGPYIVEGCAIGLIGALISYGIISMIYGLISNMLEKSYTISSLKLEILSFGRVSPFLIIGFIVIGLFIGIMGALLSTWRNIRN